jgi:hypothetical protein
MRGHRVRRLGGRAAGVRRPYYIADCGSGRITRRPLSRFRRCPDRIRWVDGPRGGESAGGVDCPWRRHLLVLFGLPGFIASANLAAGGAVHTNHFLRVFELNAQASAHRLWKHALHGGSSRASASRDRPARSDPLRPGVALRLSGRIGARGASPGECCRQRPACGAERGSTRPGVSNIRPSRSARGPIRPNPAERLSSRTLARRDTTTAQPRAVREQGRSRSVAGLRASNSSPTARRRRLAGGSRRGVRKRTGAPPVDVTWPLRLVSRSPPPGRMAARWLR